MTFPVHPRAKAMKVKVYSLSIDGRQVDLVSFYLL